MTEPQKPLDERIRDASERIGSQLEEELRRAVKFIDDEVVPEVRRNSSNALRVAADKLRKVAEHIDDERQRRENTRP